MCVVVICGLNCSPSAVVQVSIIPAMSTHSECGKALAEAMSPLFLDQLQAGSRVHVANPSGTQWAVTDISPNKVRATCFKNMLNHVFVFVSGPNIL